jgi:hypothetical protein
MQNNIEKKINSILFRNRNILKKNYFEGEVKMSKSELIAKGFDFKYHTHQIKHQELNETFVFSYDFGINEFGTDLFEVVSLRLMVYHLKTINSIG